MIHLKRLFVLAAAALLVGCNYDIAKNGSSDADRSASGGAPETADPRFNFEYVLENVITPSCFGCHKAPNNSGGLSFETYEEVFENRSVIYQAVDSFYMPESKGRTMPDDQRELLLAWIEAGAPREAQDASASAMVPSGLYNPECLEEQDSSGRYCIQEPNQEVDYEDL